MTVAEKAVPKDRHYVALDINRHNMKFKEKKEYYVSGGHPATTFFFYKQKKRRQRIVIGYYFLPILSQEAGLVEFSLD